MANSEKIIDVWNDDSWRYPLVVGGITIPIAVAFQYLDVGVPGLVLPFLAGVFVGVVVPQESISGLRIGWRTGLLSGISLLYGGTRFLASNSHIWLENQSMLLIISTFVTVPFVLLFFILLFGVAGAIGGAVGERLSDTFDEFPLVRFQK